MASKTLYHDELDAAQPGDYRMRTTAVDYADGTRGFIAFPFGPDWQNAMTSSIGSSVVSLTAEDIEYLRQGGRGIHR